MKIVVGFIFSGTAPNRDEERPEVKIAFVGKGGSGKTTLASLFARHLAASGLPVVAVDADINQHLGVALGLDEEQAAAVPVLGDHLTEIKDYLRGTNPRISSAAAMVKTTPPGTGSRLLRVLGDDPFHTGLSRDVDGVRLMATGAFDADDLGVACYHSKVGAVELYLNHLLDGPGEYVLVDMTAGADAFASGLFSRFDLTFLVAEPTRKAVSVYRQYAGYAAEYGVALAVVGNKVHGHQDVAFLRDTAGAALLLWMGNSDYVRAMEQGRTEPLDRLEETIRRNLERLRERVDAQAQDWERFCRLAAEFHRRNARAWADRAVGEDLSAQIDPDFRMPVPAPVAL
jgi:CO dehydrogenase maturation factor